CCATFSASSLALLSPENSFSKRSYSSSPILALGLVSTLCPFDERNSTIFPRDKLNSLATLLNRSLLTASDINLLLFSLIILTASGASCTPELPTLQIPRSAHHAHL